MQITLLSAVQQFVSSYNALINGMLLTHFNSGIFEDALSSADVTTLEQFNLYNAVVSCNFTQQSLRATLAEHNATLEIFSALDAVAAIATQFNVTEQTVFNKINAVYNK